MVSILNNPCGHEILTPSPAGMRAIQYGRERGVVDGLLDFRG
jgi:hypothetical protein